MNDFCTLAKTIRSSDKLAELFLNYYYQEQEITYPINPFQILVEEGVLYAMRDFGKLEGVYIPAEDENDIPFIGINMNRPITRQRFTAAHELCHFYRDTENQICKKNSNTTIEKYANNFASALLMPIRELENQVNARRVNGYVDFDAILEISQFFGVSFESCVYRIAFKLKAVEGEYEGSKLRNRIKKYRANEKRKIRGFNHLVLYEGLIDSYTHALGFKPTEFAMNVFQNNYIYNDSRLEGLEIELEEAAEIVTDLRLHGRNSKYCTEDKEAFLSIAGHTAMYSYIYETAGSQKCSIYDILFLHQKLYSYYPNPQYGGLYRSSNTLVLGAIFNTIDHSEISLEVNALGDVVKTIFGERNKSSLSSYLKHVICLHHKLTVIHPFADGNGRTLRAFLNLLLVRNNITPMYIKVEDKVEYVSALEAADNNYDYTLLLEFFYKLIIKASVELTR